VSDIQEEQKLQPGSAVSTEVTPSVNEMLTMYRMMVLIRKFEEQVRSLSQGGLVPGLVHLCAGQEATNVGTCSLLRRDDVIASHHRGHGHCLVKGCRSDLLMAEILGRRPGYAGGRSGSMHIFDPKNGNLGTNGIVGGGIPLATGAALASRTQGVDRVAVAFFGDGALNEGIVPECMNMAAIWSLPVVFVCENNGFGEYTALEDVTAGKSLIARGEVFDIPSRDIDGMNVLEVRAAFSAALRRARRGDGPSFLVCNTYRFGGHHAGDKQPYKDKEEMRQWRERDPILRLAGHLISERIAEQAELDAIDAEVNVEIRAAVDFAKAAPEPAAEDLLNHVYA
jgi:acetoin:2,6-dichlorophenolindophenol oxidoreductase subunit alpha